MCRTDITNLSKREQNFIDAAYNASFNSQLLFRHGCVAVMNGKIIGTGCNNHRTAPCRRSHLIDGCSTHAEMDVCRKLLIKVSSAKGLPKGQKNV
tara:strand:- start:1223 stop:1507 length:285 start_codon:yes stop_codon:yes gene_type:complete